MKGRAFAVLLLSVTSAAAQHDASGIAALVSIPVHGERSSAFVSASDLAIPTRARREFDKANELIRRQELEQAMKKLKKAIAIYPRYTVAYNNLAVIYSQLGDQAGEDEALEKAISLNPSFALAYVNFGRMNVHAGKYPAAELALQKAASLNPADAATLILLSYSQFMEKNFDGAIASSRKAHLLDSPHAFAHRVAARAFEQEKQGTKAIAELEMFLREEPSGAHADAVRHEIEVVRAALPN